MAITTTETYGRWTFTLTRGEEQTKRTISIPFPKETESEVESAVEAARTNMVGGVAIQPANWRDNDQTEEQWTCTALEYEIVSVSTTPY